MQPPKTYSFAGNLAYSEGHSETVQVSDILLANIPGARQVIRACTENDRTGIDYWVETTTAKLIAVDAKVRREDYATRGCDDLAIETFSVIEAGKIGWCRDESKKCDYVLWVWMETGRWCLIAFPQLCAVTQESWEKWVAMYKTARQRTSGNSTYHSECVFVPRKEVWASIYRKYSGTPIAAPLKVTA